MVRTRRRPRRVFFVVPSCGRPHNIDTAEPMSHKCKFHVTVDTILADMKSQEEESKRMRCGN